MDTTWHKLISAKMSLYGDSWDNVESQCISDAELHTEFDPGFGGPEGAPFCIWTKERVYFPHEYDGAEYVLSVSRNPNGNRVKHSGREVSHVEYNEGRRDEWD